MSEKTDAEFVAECEALIEANHGTSQTPMLTEAIERLKRSNADRDYYENMCLQQTLGRVEKFELARAAGEEEIAELRAEFEQYKEERRWDAIEREEMRDLYKENDK